MAANKLRKFPSFMIYLCSKESAFTAVKREAKICDRGTVYNLYTMEGIQKGRGSSKGEQDSESFP